MSIYRTTIRLDMENECHRQLYEWIKKRDKKKYHNVQEYFYAAAARLEGEEHFFLSEAERQLLCKDLTDELYKKGFLNNRIGL